MLYYVLLLLLLLLFSERGKADFNLTKRCKKGGRAESAVGEKLKLFEQRDGNGKVPIQFDST